MPMSVSENIWQMASVIRNERHKTSFAARHLGSA